MNNRLARLELPYRPDSSVLFSRLADRPWAVFLDSARPYSEQGRYDLIAAAPIATLSSWGALTTVQSARGTVLSREPPLALLGRELLKYATEPEDCDLPFSGGAIGYFSYDLARQFERLPIRARDSERIPDMAVGIYQWTVVVDHQLQKSWLVGPAEGRGLRALRERLARFIDSGAALARGVFTLRSDLCSNMDRDGYGRAFRRIKHYLREGDCYQVNLAQRFSAAATGDSFAAYSALRRFNPAPFSAYLNTPHVQVLCSSPERFLQVRSGTVETKPIKGTRPRSSDPYLDWMLGNELRHSRKDRAENLMIVDLLRNDLGKVCRTGTVSVPSLFALESYATVHHLVSTIRARLAPQYSSLDLLKACFPGGSITGAPKLRAMEIIEELEPDRRGIYCGSIGYVGFDGSMDTNIAIRTLVFSDGRVRFWGGGGIVADSIEEEEYQETLHKVSAIFEVLRRRQIGHVDSQDWRKPGGFESA